MTMNGQIVTASFEDGIERGPDCGNEECDCIEHEGPPRKAGMTDDIEIPDDTRRSRFVQLPPVDPDDISTLDEKIAAFWEMFPDGAIDASKVKQIAPDSWRVTAFVWKNRDSEGRADSTGSATRTIDLDGHISGQFALETAQSVAISRALRFLGFTS